MTNEQIILNTRFELMEQGIISGTGRKIIVEDENGNKKELEEPEQIHTYKGWQECKRQVRKGEKAIVSTLIWKHTIKKKEDEEAEDEKMFMTKAFFFKESQTEQIEDK